jgi:hypothetical protein
MRQLRPADWVWNTRSMRTWLAVFLLSSAVRAQEPAVDPDMLDPDGSLAPDTVQPIPAWSPAGARFEARLEQIADHIKRNNPTRDPRVHALIVTVTARSGNRDWLGRREAWTDGKVRFAVGREAEVVVPSRAIRAAERRARTAVGKPPDPDSRRLLDWFIDEDGVAYALVGRWLSVAEQEAASP